MLRRASAVHVVECCAAGEEDAASERLADVVAWLGRQGIQAEAHVKTPGGGGAAEDILSFAAVHGAGLIVAGGYGHSRMREWILGGVTRDLLTAAPVCVLLSH
jgi:nucleotide-binding universal stress UspA family protein